MKNSFFVLVLIFITSCTPKIDTSLNIDDLKKDGTTYIDSQNKKNINISIDNINKVILYPLIKENLNWSYPRYNPSNLQKNIALNSDFLKITKKDFFKIEKKKQLKRDLVAHKNNIFFVDDYSNLIIIDKNLNLLKKYIIHKKKPNSLDLYFSIIASDNLLFVSDNLGTILAFDLSKKDILWRNDFGVPFLSNLVKYKDSIFVSNSNGKLFSFNTTNGKQNWSYETGTNVIKSSEAYKISIFEDILVFSNDLGYLYCIDLKKNTLLWTYNISNLLNNSDSIQFSLSNLILESNFLYVTSSYGSFIKINTINGNIEWELPVETRQNILINPSTVSVLDKNGYFLIVNKKNGKIIFKKNTKEFIKDKTMMVSNFFVAANMFNIILNKGVLIQIDSANLNKIILKKITENIISNIIIYNSKIFFIDEKGQINKV